MLSDDLLRRTQERDLVSALLSFPEKFIDVADLPADALSFPDFRAIWRAMQDLFNRGDPITWSSVYMMCHNHIDEQTDSDLRSPASSFGSIEHLVNQIRDRSQKTKLLEAGQKLMLMAQDERPLDEAIAEAEKVLLNLQMSHVSDSNLVSAKQLAQEFLESFMERQKNGGQLMGITTGLASLDKMMMGWQPGELAIIAARPSMGKTSLSLHCAEAAAKANTLTLVFSLEMSRERLAERIFASDSFVSLSEIRRGDIGDKEPLLHNSIRKIEQLEHLLFDDSATQTLNSIRAKVLRAQRQHPDRKTVVFIDFLQLIQQDGSNDNEALTQVSRGLKALARQTGAAVVALAQLNRQVEQRQDKRPVMSDLRGSGSIEEASDTVLLLYRDSYYNAESDTPNSADIIVAKNRNGETGLMSMFFDPKTQRWADLQRNPV